MSSLKFLLGFVLCLNIFGCSTNRSYQVMKVSNEPSQHVLPESCHRQFPDLSCDANQSQPYMGLSFDIDKIRY